MFVLPLPKWTHSLGKSKADLKLKTPKRPKVKYVPCGCFYRFDHDAHTWRLVSPCYLHGVASEVKKEVKKNGTKSK